MTTYQKNLKIIMKRRSAIRNLSAAFGGLMTLPAWANGWTEENVRGTTGLTEAEEDLLAEIVETIIPETDTPGAKSLKVDRFAARMIRDCYGEDSQQLLMKGLKMTDDLSRQTFQKSYAALSSKEKEDIFTRLGNADDTEAKRFAMMIRRLAIQGYTQSEYFMTHKMNYVMAPGFYHGCVPVKS